MMEIDTILNKINWVFVFNNITAIYIICNTFKPIITKLGTEYAPFINKYIESKKIITILMSIVNSIIYYHLFNQSLEVIITSCMVSCIGYDYIIKYMVEYLESKLKQ